jgi:hypothetical protein
MVSIERDDLGGTDSGQLIAMSRAEIAHPPAEVTNGCAPMP